MSKKITQYKRTGKRAIKRVFDVIDDLNKKNISVHAAATAYYGTLAFFPFIVVVLALASFAVKPSQLTSTIGTLSRFLPSDIAALITTQLSNAQHYHANNVIVASIAFVLAMLGASGLVAGIANGLNSIYEVRETRSFIRQKLMSLALTLGAVVAVVLVVCLFVFTDNITHVLHLSGIARSLFEQARWLIVIGMMILGLGALYRFAPDVPKPHKWRWLSGGTILAMVAWAVMSLVFFWYLQNIAHLTRSYSLFAGIIGMMLWLNISAYVILLGADIDLRRKRHKLKK